MQPEKVTFCKFNRNQTKAIKAKIKPLTDQRELLGNKLPSFLLQPPLLSNTKRITKSYTMSTSVRLG